jgi:hypothetical protein
LVAAPDDTTEFLLADIDTVGNAAGIAAMSIGVDDGDGTTSITATAGNPLPINPETGVAYAVNDTVYYWPADQGTLFITRNFHDTATTAAVVPLVTDIGEIYLMSSSATAAAGLGFGLEQTAATPGTHVFAVVHDVLDSNRAPIRLSGNAGVFLVFEMKTAQ